MTRYRSVIVMSSSCLNQAPVVVTEKCVVIKKCIVIICGFVFAKYQVTVLGGGGCSATAQRPLSFE